MSKRGRARASAAARAEATEGPRLTEHAVRVLMRERKQQRPEDGVLLHVLGVHRYLIDNTFTDVTGEAAHGYASPSSTPPSGPHDAHAAWEAGVTAAAPLAAAAGGGAAAAAAAAAAAEGTNFYPDQAFDVVLADTEEKMRCVLSPRLNYLVRRGALRSFAWLRVKDWVYPRYNDLVMGGGPKLLIITDAEAASPNSAPSASPDPRALEWAVPAHERRHPLVGHRTYYQHLYDDTSPYGGRWDSLQDNLESYFKNSEVNVDQLDESSTTIREALNLAGEYHEESRPMALGRAGARGRRRRRGVRESVGLEDLPLCGVVIKKSNLVHYGKVDRFGKCPFNFHILLQDTDRTIVKVTFWTTTCAFYYPRLAIGDPVAVCRYRVKEVLNEAEFGGAVAEVAVNPDTACAEPGSGVRGEGAGEQALDADEAGDYAVRALSHEAAQQLCLDELPSPFCMLSTRQLRLMANGEVVDVAGVVSYVGPPRTTVRRDSKTQARRLHQWRWITLRDNHSLMEVAVVLSSNSQPRIFSSISAARQNTPPPGSRFFPVSRRPWRGAVACGVNRVRRARRPRVRRALRTHVHVPQKTADIGH